MELRQYWNLLRKWIWLIVLGTVLAGGTALVVSLNTTPVYQTSTTLRINPSDSSGMNEYTGLLTSQRLAQTYAELLKKDPVLDGVIANLGLHMSTKDLRDAVTVQPVRDTDLIEVSVEHTNPARAQAIANEIPTVFAKQDQAMQAARYAQLKAGLTAEMDKLEGDIRTLQEQIAAKKAAGTPEDDAALIALQSDLDQARSNFTTLLQNYGSVQLAEAQSGNNVIVAAPAKVPTSPIRPRTKMNTLLAAVVGAMLAVGVAFLVEFLDDTIKTPEDVEATLAAATLGAVARSKNGEASQGLITLEAPKSPISEAYRVLRTNVRFSNVDHPNQSLLVTSANPTEGKSTTVSNLGVVMAQAGQRVILVDSDLRRPRLQRVFELDNRQGLTDALVSDGMELNGFLQDTAVPNLRVMTSGPLPPNPSELLSSQRMHQLVDRLKAEADVVLFDSPPVMAVTDASILAKQVDGVLLVVDSGQTRRGMAEQAYRTLQQVGASVLGVILNKIALTRGGYYYYYYSGYYSDDGHGKRRHRRSTLRRFWDNLLGKLRA
jgi:capsular exopolysaccharide synthesis family protein